MTEAGILKLRGWYPVGGNYEERPDLRLYVRVL